MKRIIALFLIFLMIACSVSYAYALDPYESDKCSTVDDSFEKGEGYKQSPKVSNSGEGLAPPEKNAHRRIM